MAEMRGSDGAAWWNKRVGWLLLLLCAACGSAGPSARATLGPAPAAPQPTAQHTRAERLGKPRSSEPQRSAPELRATRGKGAPGRVHPQPGEAAGGPSRQLASSSAPRPAPKPAPPPIEIAEIDARVRHAIAQGKLPGAVVVVGRSDGVVFQKAYGHRSLVPRRTPMQPDTIFDLASLTKPLVTASAVLLLVEDGKLRLSDPVARHLPELAGKKAGAITLRELLIHGSGLPRVNPLADYAGSHAQAIAALLRVQPQAPPGKRYLYSDVGYLWLGELVERVAGQPLEQFAAERLFAPLGLTDTWFNPPPALRPRIAPTERSDKRTPELIHGEVHDPRAYRLGGVAGNAGLFSTARDLARYARMLLNGGTLDGIRVLSERSVQTMTRPQFIDGTVRTLGWDMDSDYAKPRGAMSPRAFGHGGYTGTSLWVDPELDFFVIFLSNRVHPDGRGNVIALEAAVNRAAQHALEPHPRCPDAGSPVRVGIDRLRDAGFAPLSGLRVGLLTHLAAKSSDGRTTLELLSQAPEVTLAALFTPEHGLNADREGAIAHRRDAAADIPVYSLFGKQRRPSAAMLQGLDAVVVDLVDVGARFYTYASTLREVMIAAAEQGVAVIVLDRPNPLGGTRVEGPLLDDGVHSFVNYHPLPVRHGMTLGELAELLAAEDGLGVVLQVVELRGWRRQMLFGETGLSWSPPSPNLPRAESTLLYPAVGLLEGTNLSVGRGTPKPFEQLGAPFIDGEQLTRALRARALPGLVVEPARFVPSARPYAGEACGGVRLRITDPHALEPVRTGLALAQTLHRLYAAQWRARDLHKMLGRARVEAALYRGVPPARVARLWERELSEFRARRTRVLRYPDCGRDD